MEMRDVVLGLVQVLAVVRACVDVRAGVMAPIQSSFQLAVIFRT
jgi:hypothetical protein